MNGQLDLSDSLAIIRRRFFLAAIVTAGIALGAVALALTLPPTYEAAATILVESQQIPTDLASSTVTANADERIQTIQQRLLARDNLIAIAEKLGLYGYMGTERSPTLVVDNLLSAISITQISTANQQRKDV